MPLVRASVSVQALGQLINIWSTVTSMTECLFQPSVG